MGELMKFLKFRYIMVSGILFALVTTYTNCGPGFQMASQSDSLNMSSIGLSKDNPFKCEDPNATSLAPLRRLTRDEYSNSVLGLVGSTIHTQLVDTINTLSADQMMKSLSDFSPIISDSQMSGYQSVAERAYRIISQDLNQAKALGGDCIAVNPISAACKDAAITNLGLLAFRRPLTEVEKVKYRDQVFTLGSSGQDSIGLLVYTYLLSPDFLMLVETGAPTDATPGSSFELTPYELASRLSYSVWSAPPDKILYAAAAANELNDADKLSAQVDRMLQDPRAQTKMRQFFRYWLDPRSYSASAYSASFLEGLNVDNANSEFQREMYEFIDYIVWQKKGSFRDLLTSPVSFAKTPQVAAIYGHDPVTDPSKPAMMSGRRKGLFMRGPILATEGNETHPILRGVKFNTRFLCMPMGLPSGAMVSSSQFFTDDARKIASTRDRTASMTNNVSCMGCHSMINPYGFALENFDGMGRFRNIEKAFSKDGTFLANHPINTAVDSLVVDFNSKSNVTDGMDVVDKMVDSARAPACFVEQISRYYRIRNETNEDSCMLAEMYEKVKGADYADKSILDTFKTFIMSRNMKQRRYQ